MSSLPKSCNTEPTFKGWTKPGPLPAVEPGLALENGETIDATSGHFRLFQLKDGHRFSTDDVLVAWYGTVCTPSLSTALDLGSGIGSVSTIVAWRHPHARLVTVEAQEESVRLARKSATYNGIVDRVDIRHGDMRDPESLAPTERFDLITGSPPYWPLEDGLQSDHPQKIACRFEVRGDVLDYAQVAARHLAPGGVFACVFPADQRARVTESATQSGLTIVRSKPVYFREGKPPSIYLYGMVRSDHLPPHMHGKTWTEEALIIRDSSGQIHPMYSALKLSFGFPP